jgi:hypothetical protein
MNGARPAYRSYGALARACLRNSGWPSTAGPRARSLASLFSKLDREVELDWLTERTGVQVVLADVLGCAVSDIQSALGAGPQAPDRATRRVRLDDLRFARTLDLIDEPLPPGIPEEVLHPATWGRSWWLAPSGSGRSLAGRWLEARGLARFVSATNWAEAAERLATQSPVFVELTGSATGEAPLRERICVAAATPPPGSDWRIIATPDLEAVLAELVAWACARLEDPFDERRALAWLAAERRASGEPRTLGAALGLIGAIDELGLRSLERGTLLDAARRVVNRRLVEWRRLEKVETAALERSGLELIVGLIQSALTDDERPPEDARSLDDWRKLVPPEHRTGPDLEWLRLTLPEVERGIRASDLDRAARRLPPGAHRIVRALSGARLLAPAPVQRGDEEQLVLSPRWVASIARSEAVRRLVASSPLEWGEALLRVHAAPAILSELLARVRTGDLSALHAVLELDAEDNPAHVAALEAAFRSVGLALLGGLDLPGDLAEALWSEQMRLRMALPAEPPRARIEHASASDPELGSGAWQVAVLAVAEVATGLEHAPVVDLDAIAGFAECCELELAAEIFALVDRRRRAIGSHAAHRLELPGALAERAGAGAVDLELVRAVRGSEPDRAGLARIAGAEFPRLARLLWEAWQRAGQPALPPLLAGSARLHRHLPAALVGPAVARAIADDLPVPYAAFGEEQWRGFCDACSRLALGRSEAAAWRAVPRDGVARALDQGLSKGALELLWQRFPEMLRDAVARRLERDEPLGAAALLVGAPDGGTAEIVALWRAHAVLDRLPEEALTELRRWLHDRVATRADGWREAYELLAEAERLIASSRGG